MDKPTPLSDTGRELAAVRAEIHETSGIVVGLAKLMDAERKARVEDQDERQHRHTGYTPPPVSESSETIRSIAEKVFDDKIRGHRLDCMEPGGGLCEVGKKVDKILEVMSEARGEKRVMAIGRAALGAAALAVLGFTLNHFAAKRSADTLQKQIETAREVAGALKAVQDAAKGIHGSLESTEPPACKFSVAP